MCCDFTMCCVPAGSIIRRCLLTRSDPFRAGVAYKSIKTGPPWAPLVLGVRDGRLLTTKPSDTLGVRLMKGRHPPLCLHVCMHAHVCKCMQVCIHVCAHTCICAHVCRVKTSEPLSLYGVRLLQVPSWPESPGKRCLINIELSCCPGHTPLAVTASWE